MSLSIEDAVAAIERTMRAAIAPPNPNQWADINRGQTYGYDVYLIAVATDGLGLAYGSPEHAKAVSVLADAAWWFVGRGLLRPGVVAFGSQQSDPGVSFGFSVTAQGREWLSRESPPDVPVSSPSRLRTLMEEHRDRFGVGFLRRAFEAVDCYDVRQYLACCVMAGAAAEGIILAAAIAKTGQEEETVDKYLGRDGRREIEKLLTGQAKGFIKDEYRSFMDLLKFWRDNAAHGAVTDIAEQEAYLAIINLARFARFVDKNWDALTGTTG